MIRTMILIAATALLPAAALAQEGDAPADERPQITLGNGENSAIIVDGATRTGATFRFPTVKIDRSGFLVMHPFRDGVPEGTVYVGAAPVPAGISHNVPITIESVPETGDMFIVMLHYDMNDDRIFDFGDGITVPDVPVFEGSTMIAHRYATPPEGE